MSIDEDPNTSSDDGKLPAHHHSYSSLVYSTIEDYYHILHQELLVTLPPEIDKPEMLMDIYHDLMREQINEVCTYQDEHHDLAWAA